MAAYSAGGVRCSARLDAHFEKIRPRGVSHVDALAGKINGKQIEQNLYKRGDRIHYINLVDNCSEMRYFTLQC